jgi:hypothetical protein
VEQQNNKEGKSPATEVRMGQFGVRMGEFVQVKIKLWMQRILTCPVQGAGCGARESTPRHHPLTQQWL